MHIVDWLIIILPVLAIAIAGAMTQRHMKSVAHFVSGGRVAGRYLLTVAKGEMGAGAVVFVAIFEQIAQAGFTLAWWQWLQLPVLLLVAVSGFVVYRFRETRAMTLAQFFEIRYSKRFRLFAGVLGFLAGILNFGIIPAVGSRFMVYILELPAEIHFGALSVPTYAVLMAIFLSITLVVTVSGGFITVMITDCLEGIFSQLSYLLIIGAILIMFNWNEITEVLVSRAPGQSMINPFDTLQNRDFNIWYVLMAMCLSVYGTMAWQNASAYNSAALNPHESRMASVLGRWRENGKMAVIVLLAVAAMTFLQHPDFSQVAAPAHEVINQISDPQIQKQMQVPVGVAYMLPIGIKGILCAILIMGIIGGDSTHLHSWGGIFVQDIIVPLRKKPLAPKQHIRYLRLAIIGVATFAFLFGISFRQTEYIYMWWGVTMGIFVGGAGSAIIGGLYWKKGTTAGAWTAILSGSLLSAGGILARQIYGEQFPLNGIQVSFLATIIAICGYIIVSLLTSRQAFDMERMLHRGPYALEIEAKSVKRTVTWAQRLIGFDENFTRGDKWIAGSLFAWGCLWFLVSVIGSAWNFIAPWPQARWLAFWHVVGVGIPVLVAVVTGIWFTIGAFYDIRRLFSRLSAQTVNPLDDGTVKDHQNLGESKK